MATLPAVMQLLLIAGISQGVVTGCVDLNVRAAAVIIKTLTSHSSFLHFAHTEYVHAVPFVFIVLYLHTDIIYNYNIQCHPKKNLG